MTDPIEVLRETTDLGLQVWRTNDRVRPKFMAAVDALAAVVALRDAARKLFILAAVAHEGDPWYAEHEGLDAEAILRNGRDALALFSADAGTDNTEEQP